MPKITGLTPAVTPIAGSTIAAIVQSGETRQVAVSDIRNSPDPIVLAEQSATPSAPASGVSNLYAQTLASRPVPFFQPSSGAPRVLQPSLFAANVGLFTPATGSTAGTTIGFSVTASGTASHPTQASTSLQTSLRRTQFASAATAGSIAGIRTSSPQVWRGNAAGLGGFFFYCRFFQSTNTASTRAFVGLNSTATPLSTDPSLGATHAVGVGYDSTDAIVDGWKIIRNDGVGSSTKTLLSGAPRDTSSVYDLYLYGAPNSSTITMRLVNLTTGAVPINDLVITSTDAFLADLPNSTTFLYLHATVGNAAVASAVQIEIARMYVESET